MSGYKQERSYFGRATPLSPIPASTFSTTFLLKFLGKSQYPHLLRILSASVTSSLYTTLLYSFTSPISPSSPYNPSTCSSNLLPPLLSWPALLLRSQTPPPSTSPSPLSMLVSSSAMAQSMEWQLDQANTLQPDGAVVRLPAVVFSAAEGERTIAIL